MTELKEPTFPSVNEVCREWIVREDNALAHRLQTQEISEHYRGNRFRNQVVRQDFPTALSEQIKEKEVADQQTQLYQQMVNAQAEADAVVARQIAEKMQREQEVERRRDIQQSEMLARRLQDELVVSGSRNGAEYRRHEKERSPKPVANELPIPPKGIKSNGPRRLFTEADQQFPTTSNIPPPQQTNIAYARDNPQLNYVSLELHAPKDSQKHLQNHHATQYTQVFAHNPGLPSPPGTLKSPPSPTDSHHYEHINLHSHTPEKSNPPTTAQPDYSFPAPNKVALPPKPTKTATSPTKLKSKQYELPKLPPKSKDLSPSNSGVQMLTTDSFDMLMGNRSPTQLLPDECDSLAVGGAACSSQYESERVFNSNSANINRIDSVNDILNYDDDFEGATPVNVDRIRQLQELGVPADEIFEINKRMTQQEKDEELARQLQEQEAAQSLSQEEKDRLIAIEAQDKELARMLQEREKAKARRAKERARARKQQMQQETEEARHVEGAAPPSSHHRQHSDLADPEHDSYSDPIDLINAQENANKHRPPSAEYVHSKQNSDASRDSYLYTDDSYSNPIDMMNDPNHNVSPPRTRGHHASAGHKSPRTNANEGTENANAAPHTGASAAIPNHPNDGQHFLPAHLKYTTPDQNLNVPPYMPIQGTRRSNASSTDSKKKKSKDSKCNQQ